MGSLDDRECRSSNPSIFVGRNFPISFLVCTDCKKVMVKRFHKLVLGVYKQPNNYTTENNRIGRNNIICISIIIIKFQKRTKNMDQKKNLFFLCLIFFNSRNLISYFYNKCETLRKMYCIYFSHYTNKIFLKGFDN